MPSHFRVTLSCCVATLLLGAAALADDSLPRRAMFGVQLAPVTEENFATLGLEKPTGILISGTFPNTPAANAGLKEGDVILRVDKTDILKFDDFIAEAQKRYGGDEVTLAVRRQGETLELKFALAARPTETDPEFDLVYDTLTIGDLRLRTIVTKPRAAGKHPAILYVQNLGPMSIDWFSPQMQNPTRTLLYSLTRKGVVTMRVELAGIGDSQGPPAVEADFQSHLPHLAAAVRRLGQYDFVDSTNVFILGDRFGGVAAPFVAADAQPKGIITWGAIGRPFIEAQLDGSRQHQKLEAYSDTQINETLTAMKDILDQVLHEGKSPQAVRDAKPEYAPLLAQLSPQPDTLLGRNVKFFRQIVKLDLAAAWKKVSCPVLVLSGAGDWAICKADGEAIAAAVNAGQAGRAQFVELPGIDGMLSKVQDMEESYLAGTPGAFNPVIVDEICRWLEAQRQRPGME